MQTCLLEAGEKDTRHDKNHRSGSAARQGGAPALPTSAAVGRKWKKVGFSFGIVITLSIFVL